MEPPEGKNGTADQNDDPVRVLKNGERVYLLPGATILDQTPEGDANSVDNIVPGDNVFYHGLNACADNLNVDSYAFIVQVVS